MKILQAVSYTGAGMSLRSFPDSALLKGGKPVFLPEQEHEYRLTVGVGLVIGKLGKGFAPRFADRYVEQLVAASVFEDVDMARKQIENGLDPSVAWMFDGAVHIGSGVSSEALGEELTFRLTSLHQGGNLLEERVCGARIMPDWKELLARVAQTMTFKTGDMVILGRQLPVRIKPDMRLTAHVDSALIYDSNNNKHHDTILDFNIK